MIKKLVEIIKNDGKCSGIYCEDCALSREGNDYEGEFDCNYTTSDERKSPAKELLLELYNEEEIFELLL